LFLRTKLDETPIFTGKKRRLIEFGSEEERRKSGGRAEDQRTCYGLSVKKKAIPNEMTFPL
jgi:hypothetical protein